MGGLKQNRRKHASKIAVPRAGHTALATRRGRRSDNPTEDLRTRQGDNYSIKERPRSLSSYQV